ncbi:MAG TPA: (d)CMP kinase [Acidimicrobiales bacterium]|nr:(d)CMP kinase [Acidimicrobiales bacterium]
MKKTIAIDGPAGAGKSTLARLLAEHFGLERLDTGAMYRAVAWAALERGIDPGDREAVADLARGLPIELGDRVLVDGEDATTEIRSAPVDAAVSVVAANPEVRRELVGRQRRWVEERGGGVVEGRDIGSVVLPDADLKVYLTASSDERARRRARERCDGRSVEEIARQIDRRDELDSNRSTSPLPSPQEAAADALIVESTGRSAEAVMEEVLRWL